MPRNSLISHSVHILKRSGAFLGICISQVVVDHYWRSQSRKGVHHSRPVENLVSSPTLFLSLLRLAFYQSDHLVLYPRAFLENVDVVVAPVSTKRPETSLEKDRTVFLFWLM